MTHGVEAVNRGRTPGAWRVVERRDGLRRLVWSGAEADVERSIIEALVGLWHPSLLSIDRVQVRAGTIVVYSRPFFDVSHGLGADREVAAAVLERATQTAVSEPLMSVDVLPGAAVAAPPPACWSSTREPSNGNPRRLAAEPRWGLELRDREQVIALARDLLAGSASGARGLVLCGEPGIGKSRLLDCIGLVAAWTGARLTRHVPHRLPDSRRPQVLLLDDRDRHLDGDLVRLAGEAENEARDLVVFATSTATPQPALLLPGLDRVETCRLPPLPAAVLRASLIGASEGRVDHAWMLEARGNPGRARVLLEARHRGIECAAFELTVDRLLASLAPASVRALALFHIEPAIDRVELLERASGGAPDWSELAPLLAVSGRRVRPVCNELAATAHRLTGASAPTLAGQAAVALGEARGQDRELGCLARLSLRAGNQTKALDHARRAVRDLPRDESLRLLSELRHAGLPADADLRAIEVGLLESNGRVEEAMALLGDPVSRGPGNPDRHLWFGELALRRGDLPAVRATVEAAPDLRREAGLVARQLYLEARLARAAGDPARACGLWRRGLERLASGRVGLDRRAHDELIADGELGLGEALLAIDLGDERGAASLAAARRSYSRLGRQGKLSDLFAVEASLHERRGSAELAAEYRMLALETALAAGDKRRAANCHREVADAALADKKLVAAERHYRFSSHYSAALGLPRVRAVEMQRVGILLELGRLRDADVILASLSPCGPSGEEREVAEHRLLTGRLASIRNDALVATAHLEEARTIFAGLGDVIGEASTALALASRELDSGAPAAAIALADSALERLGSRPCEDLRARLGLVSDLARLELAPTARARHVAGDHGEATSGDGAYGLARVAVRAAAAAPAAGVTTDSSRPYEAALEAAAKERRVELLGRLIAAADRALGNVLPAALRDRYAERLNSLVADPALVRRLRQLGVTDADASPPSGELSTDALAQLDTVLRSTDDASLVAALELLAGRVRFTRAAVVGDSGDGPRVLSSVQARSGDRRLPDGCELSRILVARARLIETDTLQVDLTRGGPVGSHPETTAWGLGPAVVVLARDRLALYLDRSEPSSVFVGDEIRFARAFIERVALERSRARPEATSRLEDEPDLSIGDLGIWGSSPEILRVRREIRELAAFDVPLFLSGESGTGKELVARAVHSLSRRRDRAFVPLNCAAMTDGLLESELFGYRRGAFTGADRDRAGLLAQADGGTLFLDEIAELSPAFQAKLLRVAELGEYRPLGTTDLRSADVRFVSATHRDILAAVRAGSFREDLYYRLLATAVIDLPPLRARGGDLLLLAERFVERASSGDIGGPFWFTPEALAVLEGHAFPGNIRELERLIDGLAARCGGRTVRVADLPPAFRPEHPAFEGRFALARREFERRYVRELLAEHDGNRTKAARSAGIARQTLVTMLKRLGMNGDQAPHSSGRAGDAVGMVKEGRVGRPPGGRGPLRSAESPGTQRSEDG